MLYLPLLQFLLDLMTLATLSANVLNLEPLLVLLLVLLHILYVLRPPVQPPISAGIIKTWGSGSSLQNSVLVGSGKLTGQ